MFRMARDASYSGIHMRRNDRRRKRRCCVTRRTLRIDAGLKRMTSCARAGVGVVRNRWQDREARARVRI